ncbi:MAG: hypothetical protein JWN76_1059 [Chitinophagaceae bacterium]|nr:hypothetical protein [Chitinophagaceae bacterium]
MKHFKLFSAFALAAGMLFTACNNADTKTETTTDSTAAADSTSAAAQAPSTTAPAAIVIIKHKVADFSKWKAAYDGHDSARLANGLHNFVIGRGVVDSNIVLIALQMDDTTKAKDFFTNKDLKQAMQKGGVIGAPEIKFVNMQRLNNDQANQRVIITHKVKDYDAWKKVFDQHDQARKDAGLTVRSLGQSISDNHMVTVVFNVADLQKAKAFMSSQGLKDKMAQAGVEGKPDVFLYNVVQQY